MPMHSNLAPGSRCFSCCICNEFVELENAKADEIGRPVHEDCYVQMISHRNSGLPPPKTLDSESNRKSPSKAIITFLNSIEAQPVMNFCPVCGSQLEHRNLTFFFEGQSRTARLSICLDCHPLIDVPPHDA
jgi:hypothetical protein